MPRTDDDSWDITRSVGVTALGVAAARAETARHDPLIRDPFARRFLTAAGDGVWNIYFGAEQVADELDQEVRKRRQVMVDYMACRTAYFDEFFLTATNAGIRQVVIVAAGLDARAWRLGGTTVYEIDQSAVLEFKSAPTRPRVPACVRRLAPRVSPTSLRCNRIRPCAPVGVRARSWV